MWWQLFPRQVMHPPSAASRRLASAYRHNPCVHAKRRRYLSARVAVTLKGSTCTAPPVTLPHLASRTHTHGPGARHQRVSIRNTASYELTKGCTALHIPQKTAVAFLPQRRSRPRRRALLLAAVHLRLMKIYSTGAKCRERCKRPLVLHTAGHEWEEAAVPVLSDGGDGGDGEVVGQLHATCREKSMLTLRVISTVWAEPGCVRLGRGRYPALSRCFPLLPVSRRSSRPITTGSKVQ